MTDQPYDLIVVGDVVLPDSVLAGGFIAIRDGRIAALDHGPLPPARAVDVQSDSLLFPGLIDAQTHAGSFDGVAGLDDATCAAAAGGVTTIVDMPFDEPLPVNSLEAFTHKVEAVGRYARVDVALYVTAPKSGDRSIRELVQAGAAGVKLSTYEYHPTRFPRFSTGEMYEVFQEAAELGAPVAFHNEDQAIVDHLVGRALDAGDRSAAAHARTRPPLAELVANAQILELALRAGVRCHIVHSTLAAGNRQARHYCDLGAKITVETCIHYLIFTNDDMLAQGAFLKINPPLRDAAERAALWESLIKGEVDLVSTDHVAWPENRKSDPDIFKNGSGIPGLETWLPAFYTSAVCERGLPPSFIARLTAENPARHFGLFAKKGRIEVGFDADIAVLKRVRHRYDCSRMASKTKWSPFRGMTFEGAVAATYVRGRKVYDNGQVTAPAGYGQFVRPLVRS